MKIQWHKDQINLNNPIERLPVPIVHDGAIATVPVGDGRLIPCLIIDVSLRPDIKNMIRAHQYFGTGDARTYWSKISKSSQFIALIIAITKPSQCTIILEFNLYTQSGIVDQIVQSQAVYLQCGKEGDKIMSSPKKDMILVEVYTEEFRNEWNKIFHQSIERHLRRY